jgi:hypothetical protein
VEQLMARPVTVTIPPYLGKDEARRRIEEGFGQLRQQMSGGFTGMLKFQQQWEGDRLQFEGGGLGQKFSGRLDVMQDWADSGGPAGDARRHRGSHFRPIEK